MWQMAISMWRMALLPSILKIGYFVQTTLKSMSFYLIFQNGVKTCFPGHKICKQT